MQEQVERLTRLATDLLDLSRIDAGRFAVEQRPLDLGEIAEAAAEEFAAVARSTGHPLEVVPARDPVRAIGDAQRVLQIARILVENSLLHTAAGTPIRVRVEARDGRAALVVEDEGDGIPPDARSHVFERFYRVDGGRASGSGLGLAIAQELARVMGGDIRLESSRQRTRFMLLLPLPAEVHRSGETLVTV
jgi:signal transduction histidine kinase